MAPPIRAAGMRAASSIAAWIHQVAVAEPQPAPVRRRGIAGARAGYASIPRAVPALGRCIVPSGRTSQPPPQDQGESMSTRTIAIVAAVIAIVVLIILLT